MLICCLFKLKDSFNRFKLSENISNNDNLKLEYIETLEDLQEKISYQHYDLGIIDNNIWWNEEAEELFHMKDIQFIYFKGDFKILEDSVVENVKNYQFEDENQDYVEDDTNIQTYKDENKEVEKEVKYIIQEKTIEVPKIIYKTKNIKQEIISVISENEFNIKNIFGINLGLSLSNDFKTLLVDNTKYNNLVYLSNCKINIKKDNISELNPGNIMDYSYEINEDLHLIKLKNYEKKDIKKILFAARDYEKIVFITDYWKDSLALSASHKVYIVTDPCLISLKVNMYIIEKIKEQGQINENIFFIITSNEVDKENVKYMYKEYELYFIDRKKYIVSANKKKIIKDFYKQFNDESDNEKTTIKSLFSKIKF